MREYRQYGNYISVEDCRDVEGAIEMLREAIRCMEKLLEDHTSVKLGAFELVCHSKEQNLGGGASIGWRIEASIDTDERERYLLGSSRRAVKNE